MRRSRAVANTMAGMQARQAVLAHQHLRTLTMSGIRQHLLRRTLHTAPAPTLAPPCAGQDIATGSGTADRSVDDLFTLQEGGNWTGGCPQQSAPHSGAAAAAVGPSRARVCNR